jgi:diamine N-acetyltransferase
VLTNPSFIIRAAVAEDVAALVELGATTFRETYQLTEDLADMDDYVSREFTPEIFNGILNDPKSILLVALEGHRFVGYAHLLFSDAPPCVGGPAPIELKRLYLRQDVIGKGYGARLMNESLEVARRRDCKTMWLVVYIRNEHAREFYRRWRFVDVGIMDFYFGGRAYPEPVMARAIE